MQYMRCTACRAVVELNNTGICLGCQMGKGVPIESNLYEEPPKKLKKEKKNVE